MPPTRLLQTIRRKPLTSRGRTAVPSAPRRTLGAERPRPSGGRGPGQTGRRMAVQGERRGRSTRMRPVRTCWSVAVRGTVVLLALVCALAGAASAEAATNLFTTIGITTERTRAPTARSAARTVHGARRCRRRGTVGPAPDDAADDVPVRMPDTTGNVANLAEYRGQTLDAARGPTRRPTPGSTSSARRPTARAAATSRCTYDDGVDADRARRRRCPDWCQPATRGAHRHRPAAAAADRPRARTARRCCIFHAPVDNPAPDEEARRR